jgi:hypothetical protein
MGARGSDRQAATWAAGSGRAAQLLGVQERVALLRGQCTMQGDLPGAGTQARVEVQVAEGRAG